jgi:hypothetical protein
MFKGGACGKEGGLEGPVILQAKKRKQEDAESKKINFPSPSLIIDRRDGLRKSDGNFLNF